MTVFKKALLINSAGAALFALAAALAFAPDASGFGASGKAEFIILEFPGSQSDERADSLKKLSFELMRRTSVEAKLVHPKISIESDEIFDSPFLFMYGENAFPEWKEEWRLRLARYLNAGGFLFIDSDSSKGDGFDKSIRRELAAAFPGKPLKKLEPEHTVYKSFFLLKEQAGRLINKPYLEGLDADDRSPVIYSQNDITGAFLTDAFGNYKFDVTPGGETQREMSMRYGVNIIMYALCVNYKSDQVHIPFILKRRR